MNAEAMKRRIKKIETVIENERIRIKPLPELLARDQTNEAELRDINQQLAQLQVRVSPLEKRRKKLLDQMQADLMLIWYVFGKTYFPDQGKRGMDEYTEAEKVEAANYYYRNLRSEA